VDFSIEEAGGEHAARSPKGPAVKGTWAALLAVVLALSLQTTVVYETGGNRPVVDLVLVVVVYVALSAAATGCGPTPADWCRTRVG
jgi:hypothetical protein